MLTHDNLASNSHSLVGYWRFTQDDVLIHALPIYHTHGLFVASNVTLFARASMIFLPKLDPELIIKLMKRATVLMGVPTFYTRLLQSPNLTKESTSHMRLFISGSAPLLAETHREWSGAYRTRGARALRHDRNQHEHVEPLRRRARAGRGGLSATGRLRARDQSRDRRRTRAGRDRHDRGQRPERVQGLLAHAGQDQSRIPRRRFLHHRRSRQDRYARLCPHSRTRQGSGDFRRFQCVPEGSRERDRRPFPA